MAENGSRLNSRLPWTGHPAIMAVTEYGSFVLNALKRVAVLYGAGKYFFCRHCYNLADGSQQESRPWRLMRKSRKIRKQLGGSVDMSELFPEKPNNMHWKTYYRYRLLDEAERVERLSWLIMGQLYGMSFP